MNQRARGQRPPPAPAADDRWSRRLGDATSGEQCYEIVTPDGWTLVVTRRPGRQVGGPLQDLPVLMVHGFSQNRLAWTAGDLVERLVDFGLDVHLLELRGHGRSSRELQAARAAAGVRPLPPDWRWHWDFSDYLLHDVPTAIDAVKAVTGRERIGYVGHSMGGIIGWALAAQRDDLLGLATLGSPAALGSEAPWLRLLAQAEPLLPALRRGLRIYERGRQALGLTRLPKLSPDVMPVDLILGQLYRSILFSHRRTPWLWPRTLRLFNPEQATPEVVEWLLEHGEEKEPMNVARTFIRWIRRRELVCYRTGLDVREALRDIRVPTALIYGDQDVLAGERSSRAAWKRLGAPDAMLRPLAGGAHIDITMGHAAAQTAEDLRELMLRGLAAAR